VFARTGLIVAAIVLAWVGPAVPADRANIPLKNWGGFSVFRDAVYDDLERLVTAGAADRVILNTKPLSRLEAARIVARAIEKIRTDPLGEYNSRRDLEPVLDRLMEEFRPELRSLGVKVGGASGAETPFFSFLPVDRALVGAGYANRSFTLVNSQGFRLRGGANGEGTFESRAQVGDFLSFYLQPEVLGAEDYGALRVATGYTKLTLYNVEFFVGRDSLWWGPGYHGSLILSANAPPLDHLRLGAAEPFRLPWIGEWVGPTKLTAFLARMEARSDHPHARLFGARGTVTPFSFLEIGASYTNLFGGTDRPSPRLRDYPRILFNPATDQKTDSARLRNNVLLALDADLRLRNVNRYFVPARDARLYGEFGWDDTCCSSSFIPLRDAASGLVGLELLGLLEDDGLDARVEWARSSRFSFIHNQFSLGYTRRGSVLSHVMGTEGTDYFTRLTKRISEDWMIGWGVNRAVIGDTRIAPVTPKERRLGGEADVSYRFAKVYSLFGQYQLIHVSNRNFVAGDDGYDHLLLFELTRSFR
jgi:hypothetical protein